MADQEKDIKGIIENSANNQSNAPVVKEELIGRHDRKKTISLIRYVLQKMEDKKTPHVPLHYTLIALYNSLELLSDLEPRVLSLEELLNLPKDTPVFIEENNGDCGWNVFYGIDEENDIDEEIDVCFCGFKASADYYEVESYGKEYICWTTRPTDEQRKEVKWDG